MAAVKEKAPGKKAAPKAERAIVKIHKEAGDGSWREVRWYDEASGTAQSEFSVPPEPTAAHLGARWGCGKYRFYWLSKARKSLGKSPVIEVADPATPDRGFYPNDPNAAAAAAAPPPPAPPPPVGAQMFAPPPGVDMVPVQVFHYMYTMAMGAAERQVLHATQAHQQEVERIKASAALTLAQTVSYWQATAELAKKAHESPEVAALAVRVAAVEAEEEDEDEGDEGEDGTPKEGFAAFMADPDVQGTIKKALPMIPALLGKLAEWAGVIPT